MRASGRVWLALVVVVVVVAAMAWLAGGVGVVRVALALLVCLVLPGLGWARKVRLRDVGDTVALAVALSVCLCVATATTMAFTGWWSAPAGLAVLLTAGVAGFVPGARLLAHPAVERRLTAGADEEVAEAWSTWYQRSQAQQGQADGELDAATADWITWYDSTLGESDTNQTSSPPGRGRPV